MRWYNQFKGESEEHIFIDQKYRQGCANGAETDFSGGLGAAEGSFAFHNKNDFALLSVIYNFQRCQIASINSESHMGGNAIATPSFSTEAYIFFPLYPHFYSKLKKIILDHRVRLFSLVWP